jgi:hypothetical protein
MSKDSRRHLGNVLIFGISGPAVLAILVLALLARPWTGQDGGMAYLLFPIMLIGMSAAHIGSRLKATAKT